MMLSGCVKKRNAGTHLVGFDEDNNRTSPQRYHHVFSLVRQAPRSLAVVKDPPDELDGARFTAQGPEGGEYDNRVRGKVANGLGCKDAVPNDESDGEGDGEDHEEQGRARGSLEARSVVRHDEGRHGKEQEGEEEGKRETAG